jgi:hypothetical protein
LRHPLRDDVEHIVIIEVVARAFALLSEGALRPDASWLDERPLHAGAASFEELLAGQARATKIVLRPA